ncbi:MAG: FtsQ-type POTRA domain-containing protein [Actinomycetaceae bacterium]|nr:FtsQ-type POTRA domain-containing protein [Actinomycetaceae bacterium]
MKAPRTPRASAYRIPREYQGAEENNSNEHIREEADTLDTEIFQSKRATFSREDVEKKRENFRRAQKKKRLFIFLGAIAFVFLVLLGFWVLYFSSVFQFSIQNATVEIQGEKTIHSEDVMSSLSAVHETPLMRINKDELTENIQKSVPRLVDVTVERDFPHGLIVKARERTVIAFYEQNSEYKGVDSEGVSFTVDAEETYGKIRIEGSVDFLNSQGLHNIFDIYSDLPQEIHDTVKEIQMTQSGRLIFLLSDSRSIYWGDFTKKTEKIQILNLLKDEKGPLIDVSYPKKPVVGPSVSSK